MKKFKLNCFDNYQDLLIGQGHIPLWLLIKNLTEKRKLDKKRIIEYLKLTYDIDIEKCLLNINDYSWLNINLLELFLENQNIYDVEHTREYFSNKFNRIFNFYLNFCGIESFIDGICSWQYSSEVHHIQPLCYGGKNDIENLIQLNNNNHLILHMNPLENIHKYCNQSLDYMAYLYSEVKYTELVRKYSLSSAISDRLFKKNFQNVIEEEMLSFYELLKDDKAA